MPKSKYFLEMIRIYLTNSVNSCLIQHSPTKTYPTL